MGTNYYWFKKPPCEKCGRSDDPIHIGKSSGGWCFSLHVFECDGPRCLEDWKNCFTLPGTHIEDEYGQVTPMVGMLAIICERRWEPSDKMTARWYDESNAEPGPNGLARHRIDGHYCIGHGEGTWDLIRGEFS